MSSEKFTDLDYWKAIILYGLNQATYKIALGRTLLQLSDQASTAVEWSDLSKVFLDNYIARLKNNPQPQQSNPHRLTVMERIVSRFNNGLITYSQALDEVSRNAFDDVIPRFQTIGRYKGLIGEKFYHFNQGKKLFLHDSLFKINEIHRNELEQEIDARWSLLEGAFLIGRENWELTNDIRQTYLIKGYERTDLTQNIDFLAGYQGNVCFYCGEPMLSTDIHVDHVLPRQVIQHDEVWNLVLSHSLCNLHKDDALVGLHYIEKLIARNENIMGSNHPWKKKISDGLGNTKNSRRKNLLYHYNQVKTVLHGRYWENSPNYNRETDPFFKKLITVLNNS
jgi:hypothetical protein